MSDNLERTSEGFKSHTEQKHNLWNYVFYIAYIMDKEETELTGFESFVREKYLLGENDWFPVKEAFIKN